MLAQQSERRVQLVAVLAQQSERRVQLVAVLAQELEWRVQLVAVLAQEAEWGTRLVSVLRPVPPVLGRARPERWSAPSGSPVERPLPSGQAG